MRNITVIIGGGFAGRQACRALRRAETNVVLIDPSPVTTMLPSLPDLAGGWISENLLQNPLPPLLPSNAQHRQAAVTSIDLEASTIIAGGETLAYDQLVIASGSVPNFHNFPGTPEQLHPLATIEDAHRIRTDFEVYLQKPGRPHLMVAGGGFTGLELAMSLYFRARSAGKCCRITLVDPAPRLLGFLPDKRRQPLLDFLATTGVEIRRESRVESFDGSRTTAGGITDEHVFLCWAGGSKLAIPEIKGEVEQIRDGRLKVNADLSLPQYPHVFAAGDSVAIEQNGAVLRKAVNFAYYGGAHAGRNIARQLRGQLTRPFRPLDLGWVIPLHTTSIGRLPAGLWVRGFLGVRLHHLMCGLRNTSLQNFAGCLKLALKGRSS